MTAVEWLFEQIPFEWSSSVAAFEALQQAKEMEKEQLKLFFMQGVITKCESFFDSEKLAEQYYNETYNTQAQ
jgi:hypothetical protein